MRSWIGVSAVRLTKSVNSHLRKPHYYDKKQGSFSTKLSPLNHQTFPSTTKLFHLNHQISPSNLSTACKKITSHLDNMAKGKVCLVSDRPEGQRQPVGCLSNST